MTLLIAVSKCVWIDPRMVMDFTPARLLGLDGNEVFLFILCYIVVLIFLLLQLAIPHSSVAPSFEIKFVYRDCVRQLDFLNSQQMVTN